MKRKDKQIIKAYAQKLRITDEDVLFRSQMLLDKIDEATWKDIVRVLERQL